MVAKRMKKRYTVNNQRMNIGRHAIMGEGSVYAPSEAPQSQLGSEDARFLQTTSAAFNPRNRALSMLNKPSSS